MKKIIFVVVTLLFLFVDCKATDVLASESFVIREFDSEIQINKDSSVDIEEKITADFLTPKHGIIRVIPRIYSAKGKTINSELKLISISDALGEPISYTSEKVGQSVKYKIGDPDKTITGTKLYVIKYQMKNILLNFGDGPELYWNVTGHEWGTNIESASARITSDFAEIKKVKCYKDIFGGKAENCKSEFDSNKVNFTANDGVLDGQDFTIVVLLDKENEIVFPGIIEKSTSALINNIGYIFALLPGLIFGILWYKKGRDTKYASDTVYYKPDDKSARKVGIFERKFLPMVYSPIQGLTPSQVGTIIDEKVDINDIVAEMVELARLSYLKIQKIEKKGILGKTDYLFVDTSRGKDLGKLKDFQKEIFKSIFKKKSIETNFDFLEKILKGNKTAMDAIKKFSEGKDKVLLSSLANSFYKDLEKIRKSLYKNMEEEKIFDKDPNKTRISWVGLAIALDLILFSATVLFVLYTHNLYPITFSVISGIAALIFGLKMPSRTAWGYSLMRQSVGLKHYLKVGKWRHEINEKKMFFEEMLPLAISLGVVNSLSKDMQKLEISPPSYMTGFAMATFAKDFSAFQNVSSGNMVATPQGKSFSGRSSWSGGSGFSGGGGSSGGGFGGGGGGSW